MYEEYKKKPYNAAMGKEADERNLEMEQRGNAANDAPVVAKHNVDLEKQAERKVWALLAERPDLDARNIHVHVERGEVWLTGTVENGPSRRLAGDLLKTLFGIEAVHNELTLRERGNGRVLGAETRTQADGPGAMDGFPKITAGMAVVGQDGAHIGIVKQVLGDAIHVGRRFQHDLYIPFNAFRGIQNDQVVLSIPADDVDRWGWDKPIVIPPAPQVRT